MYGSSLVSKSKKKNWIFRASTEPNQGLLGVLFRRPNASATSTVGVPFSDISCWVIQRTLAFYRWCQFQLSIIRLILNYCTVANGPILVRIVWHSFLLFRRCAVSSFFLWLSAIMRPLSSIVFKEVPRDWKRVLPVRSVHGFNPLAYPRSSKMAGAEEARTISLFWIVISRT